MNFGQIMNIFAARWWVVVLVFGATVGTTAVITALLPRAYTATANLVIEPRFTDVLGGASLAAQMASQTYLATQIDILRSQKVAERVVKDLGIDRSARAVEQWRDATDGQGTVEAYFANQLIRRLDVRPSRESLVLTLAFSASDPLFAKQVTDAFAKAYIETNLELRTTPARQYAQWFNTQLKELRSDLETAQTKLSAFQQRNGLVGTDERLDVENSRLAELSSQLSLVQSQSMEARARADVGTPTVRSVPDVASTPLMQSLRTDIARAESKLEEAAQMYGPAHPTYQRLVAELASLTGKLETELGNARGSVESVSRVSNQREAQLRAAVAGQKDRVLDIKRLRDEMAVLQREVENAQKVYELALQRFAATNLESQTNQTNASLLNPASVPTEPSSPRTTLNLILSAIMGVLLGLAMALLLELSDRRVRNARDLAGVLKVPVLGTLPRPRRSLLLPWRRGPGLAGAGAE